MSHFNTEPYVLRMRNINHRYSLSDDVLNLFAKLNDYRLGINDPDTLGRKMRISPLKLGTMCTDIISTLAEAMQKNDQDPDHVAECNVLIWGCVEMLKLSIEPKKNDFFPFDKLPVELRNRVYELYIEAQLATKKKKTGTGDIVPMDTIHCGCAPFEARGNKPAPHVEMPLSFVSRQIKAEFFVVWYNTQVFYFSCCCHLNMRLHQSASLRNNLRNLKVHWTGSRSDETFTFLKQVPSLQSLTIVLSKTTSDYLSKREVAARRYFSRRNLIRLCDVLGYEELVALRGLKEAHVEQIVSRLGTRRSNQDKTDIENALLANVMKLPGVA